MYPKIKFGDGVALQVPFTGTLHFRVYVLDVSVHVFLGLEHVWISDTQGATVNNVLKLSLLCSGMLIINRDRLPLHKLTSDTACNIVKLIC